MPRDNKDISTNAALVVEKIPVITKISQLCFFGYT